MLDSNKQVLNKDDWNAQFYGRPMGTREILSDEAKNPEAGPLRRDLVITR